MSWKQEEEKLVKMMMLMGVVVVECQNRKKTSGTLGRLTRGMKSRIERGKRRNVRVGGKVVAFAISIGV